MQLFWYECVFVWRSALCADFTNETNEMNIFVVCCFHTWEQVQHLWPTIVSFTISHLHLSSSLENWCADALRYTLIHCNDQHLPTEHESCPPRKNSFYEQVVTQNSFIVFHVSCKFFTTIPISMHNLVLGLVFSFQIAAWTVRTATTRLVGVWVMSEETANLDPQGGAHHGSQQCIWQMWGCKWGREGIDAIHWECQDDLVQRSSAVFMHTWKERSIHQNCKETWRWLWVALFLQHFYCTVQFSCSTENHLFLGGTQKSWFFQVLRIVGVSYKCYLTLQSATYWLIWVPKRVAWQFVRRAGSSECHPNRWHSEEPGRNWTDVRLRLRQVEVTHFALQFKQLQTHCPTGQCFPPDTPHSLPRGSVPEGTGSCTTPWSSPPLGTHTLQGKPGVAGVQRVTMCGALNTPPPRRLNKNGWSVRRAMQRITDWEICSIESYICGVMWHLTMVFAAVLHWT